LLRIPHEVVAHAGRKMHDEGNSHNLGGKKIRMSKSAEFTIRIPVIRCECHHTVMVKTTTLQESEKIYQGAVHPLQFEGTDFGATAAASHSL
jgi:hypothetical protein